MAKLKKLWVKDADDCSPAEIRVNWDNDRHQAVQIKGNDPQALMNALEDLIEVLDLDAFAGEI